MPNIKPRSKHRNYSLLIAFVISKHTTLFHFLPFLTENSFSINRTERQLAHSDKVHFTHADVAEVAMQQDRKFTIFAEIQLSAAASVTRLGDFLHFGQQFKAGGNNYFNQITHIVRQFL